MNTLLDSLHLEVNKTHSGYCALGNDMLLSVMQKDIGEMRKSYFKQSSKN